MQFYKLRDVPVNMAIVRQDLGAAKVQDLEDVVFNAIKSSLPENVYMVGVDLQVTLDGFKKIGEPAPHDFTMYSWKIGVEKKGESAVSFDLSDLNKK